MKVFATFVLFSITSIISSLLFGQMVYNVRGLQEGDKAKIIYDLNGDATTKYSVILSYSTDGGNTFSKELVMISGDVKNVAPGKQKQIIWDAISEVNYVKGDVIFKIEAIENVRLPDPISVDGMSIQVMSIDQGSGVVKLELRVVEKDERLIWLAIDELPIIQTDVGNEYFTTSGRLGDEEINSKGKTKSQKMSKHVPISLYLSFDTQDEIRLISELKIKLDVDAKKREFTIKNIRIQ